MRDSPDRLRILTDLHVTQRPWWAERLTVLPRPGNLGAAASLLGAWRAVREARRHDVFITASVRNPLAVGLVKRLTFSRRPAIVMTELRLDDPRPDLRWRLKVAVQRFAFAAVDAMCVSAKREAAGYAERLRLPEHRVRFVPWHTNVLEPRMTPSDGYVFAAGRTGRDWRTLAAAAEGLDCPVTVVCSRRDAADVRFSSNVTVLADIPYPRYRELLERAAAVVIPLDQHVYSSGQVVILEAMALGKPVVASAVVGSEDYIVDDMDGLLVPPGDAAALRAAIGRLFSTPGLAERLGRTALAKVRASHTLDRYLENLLDIAAGVGRP